MDGGRAGLLLDRRGRDPLVIRVVNCAISSPGRQRRTRKDPTTDQDLSVMESTLTHIRSTVTLRPKCPSSLDDTHPDRKEEKQIANGFLGSLAARDVAACARTVTWASTSHVDPETMVFPSVPLPFLHCADSEHTFPAPAHFHEWLDAGCPRTHLQAAPVREPIALSISGASNMHASHQELLHELSRRDSVEDLSGEGMLDRLDVTTSHTPRARGGWSASDRNVATAVLESAASW